ncbi:hypothetical protein Emag_003239 [Eimeria magna]
MEKEGGESTGRLSHTTRLFLFKFLPSRTSALSLFPPARSLEKAGLAVLDSFTLRPSFACWSPSVCGGRGEQARPSPVSGPIEEGAAEATSLGERTEDSPPVAPAAATLPAASLAADADPNRTAAVRQAAVELGANAELHGSALRGKSAHSSALQRPEEAPFTATHPHAVAPRRHSNVLLSSGKGNSAIKEGSPARGPVSFEHEIPVSAAAAAPKSAVAAAAEQAAGSAAAKESAIALEGSVVGAEAVALKASLLEDAAAVAAKSLSTAAETSAAAAAGQSGTDALAATSESTAEAAAVAAPAEKSAAAATASAVAYATGALAELPRKSAAGEPAAQPPANEANFSSATATTRLPCSECNVHPCESAQREMAPTGGGSSRSSSSSSRSCCSYEDEAVLAAAALALELESDVSEMSAAAASAAGLTDAAAAAAAAAAEVTEAAASAGRPSGISSLEKEVEGLLGEAGAAAAADLMALAYQRQAPGDPRDKGAATGSGSRDAEATAKAVTTAVALAAAKALEHHRARNPIASSASETNTQEPLQGEHQQQEPQQQPQRRQDNRQQVLQKQMECLRLLLLTGCLNPRWKTYTNPQAFQFHFALLLSASVEPLFDVYLNSVFAPLYKEVVFTKKSQEPQPSSAAAPKQPQQTASLGSTSRLPRRADAAPMRSSSGRTSNRGMQVAFDRGVPSEVPDEVPDEAAAAAVGRSEGLTNVNEVCEDAYIRNYPCDWFFLQRALAAVCTSLEFVYEACRNLEVINGRWDLSPPSAAQGAPAAGELQRNTQQVASPNRVGSVGAEVLTTRTARIAAREAATPEQAAQARPLLRPKAPHFEKSRLRQEQELSLQEGFEVVPTVLNEEPSSSSKSSSSSSSGEGNRQGQLIRTLESFLSSRRLKRRPGGALGPNETIDRKNRWSSYPVSSATGAEEARKSTRGIRGKRRHTDATAAAEVTTPNKQEQSDPAPDAARAPAKDSRAGEPPPVGSPPPQTLLKRPLSSGCSDILLWDPEAPPPTRSPYPAAAEGQEGTWRLKAGEFPGPPTPSLTASPGIGSLLLPGEAARSQTASEEGGPRPQIRHGYAPHTPEKPPQQQPRHQPTRGARHSHNPPCLQQQRQQPQQHEPSDEEGSEAGPEEATDEEDNGSPVQSDQPSRAESQQQQTQQRQQQQQQGSVQITRSGRRVTFAFRVSDLINDDEQPPSPEAATAAAAREADTPGQHRPRKS